MAEDNTETPQLEIVVDWSASEAMQGSYANQMLTQVTPDDIVLIFGQIFPPPIVGSEAIRARIEATRSIAVQPVAKVILTPARLYELIELLGTTAEKLERAKAKRDEIEADEGDET